jgi:hypothetical protein
MQFDKSKLKELVKQPLTNKDLELYFGPNINDNIVKYSEIASYANINDLLPTDKTYKIILIETKLNSGHWVAILRYNNTIEVFNSYGCKPSRDDFCYVPKLTNLLLGQTEPFLNNLLNSTVKEGKFKIVYNKKKFQKMKDDINTCGRWVTNRIIMMRDFDLSLEDYIKFIEDAVKKTGLDNDYLVSYLIQ